MQVFVKKKNESDLVTYSQTTYDTLVSEKSKTSIYNVQKYNILRMFCSYYY